MRATVMYLLTIAGFVLLFGGGEFLVRGAVAVAERFGLSRLLVGLTVVAFATSAPELLVSVQSALSGRSALALGNVVGSNIANVALILGASSLICCMVIDVADVRRDAYFLFAVSVAFAAVAMTGQLGRVFGVVALLVLIGYIWYSYRAETSQGQQERDWHAEEAEEYESKTGVWAGLGLVALGVAALVLGANWLIDGASDIARSFGVPEAIVGLTIVAIGTSLPEFATSIIASFRGHADVAVGNVIGSNIFNILSILGMTALIKPFAVDPTIARVDIPVMLVATFIGVGVLIWRGRLGRWFGTAMLLGYAAYTVVLYVVGRA